MEIQRSIRYPLHGRAQVALLNHSVVAGRTRDISVGGICVVLDDQIPLQAVYPIRFEMFVKGKTHVITTRARAVYGVFAGTSGFRVGFEFKEDDPQRSALIKSLAGKKPMVEAPANANGPEPSAEIPVADENALP